MAKNQQFLDALGTLSNTEDTRKALKELIEVDLISPGGGHTIFARVALKHKAIFSNPWLDGENENTLLTAHGDPTLVVPNDVRQLQRIAAEKYIRFCIDEAKPQSLEKFFQEAQKDDVNFRQYLAQFGALTSLPGWTEKAGGSEYGDPTLSKEYLKNIRAIINKKMFSEPNTEATTLADNIDRFVETLRRLDTKPGQPNEIYIEGHIKFLDALRLLKALEEQVKLAEDRFQAIYGPKPFTEDVTHLEYTQENEAAKDKIVARHKALLSAVEKYREKFGPTATMAVDISRQSYFRMDIVTKSTTDNNDTSELMAISSEDSMPRKRSDVDAEVSFSSTDKADSRKMRGFVLKEGQVARFTADCKAPTRSDPSRKVQVVLELESSGRVVDRTPKETFAALSEQQKCELALEMAVKFLEQYDPKDKKYKGKDNHFIMLNGDNKEQVGRILAACLYLTHGIDYYKKLRIEPAHSSVEIPTKRDAGTLTAFVESKFIFTDPTTKEKRGIPLDKFRDEKEHLSKLSSDTQFHRSALESMRDSDPIKAKKARVEYDAGNTATPRTR